MKILTKALEAKLVAQAKSNTTEAKPLVKFFGGSSCTWLISEYNPETDLFFGLCDLGMGEPELGYVSRSELESIRFKPFGLGVERDLHFEADKTLSAYAIEARNLGHIKA